MIIPVHFPTETSSSSVLPPALAKLGSDEVVLVELQGFLDAEGQKDDALVGTLNIENTVALPLDILFCY